jgi:hypothetical protein
MRIIPLKEVALVLCKELFVLLRRAEVPSGELLNKVIFDINF